VTGRLLINPYTRQQHHVPVEGLHSRAAGRTKGGSYTTKVGVFIPPWSNHALTSKIEAVAARSQAAAVFGTEQLL
jgi:hypothetical protein